ncbi:MAG: molybdenum cofactor guanylyltransferase [Candidatus Hydrothermarchaeales archaeon]
MLELSCIVLVGGKSTRMGSDKRELEIGGKSFFEGAVEKARKISRDIIISLGDAGQVKGDFKDATLVIDEEKGRGPLFALASSLKRCKRSYAAVLPVDAPLLNPAIYRRMAEEIEKDPTIEAVVPRSDDGPQPLYGIYRVSAFLSACNKTIARGGESVLEAISALKKVRFIDVEEFRVIDPKLLSFHNVNTPSDLKVLEEKLYGNERL